MAPIIGRSILDIGRVLRGAPIRGGGWPPVLGGMICWICSGWENESARVVSLEVRLRS